MNRSKSITDIGSIYLEMQKQNAKSINESVIQESKKVKAKAPKDTFKNAGESVKEPSSLKKSGPKNVKGLEKLKTSKKTSKKTKKVVKEDINNFMSIFDKLYEDVMNNDELDFNTGIGTGPEGSAGDIEDLDNDTEDTDSEENENPSEMLQKAIDLLQKVADSLGEDESEDTDLEDLGVEDKEEDEQCEEDDDDDENSFFETTHIQKVPDSAGHKLTKGIDAAGNIKSTSKKANASVTDDTGTETGKHPFDHKSELTNPSKNKVGTLKGGRSLFDQ
jgi:hypothetical protein